MRRALFILLLVVVSLVNIVFAQDIPTDSSPKFFQKISVNSNKIEIIVDYQTKYIVNLNQEMELLRLDDNGKEVSRTKAIQASASQSEKEREDLKLITWNNSEATFEFSYECGIPACDPPVLNKYLFQVKGLWKRK